MTSDVQMVETLVSRFPALQDAYESHMDGRMDVPVPHVFFWEVFLDVRAAFLAGDSALLDWRAVLDFLESQVERGDPAVNEVIMTSFLWYLPWPGQPGHELTTMLGPVLTAKLKLMRPEE